MRKKITTCTVAALLLFSCVFGFAYALNAQEVMSASPLIGTALLTETFENGFSSNWKSENFSLGSLTTSTAEKHTGNASLKFDLSKSTGATAARVPALILENIQNPLTDRVIKIHLSFWVKSNATEHISVFYTNFKNVDVSADADILEYRTVTNDWSLVEANLALLPGEKGELKIQSCMGYSKSNIIYIDDIVLTITGEEEPVESVMTAPRGVIYSSAEDTDWVKWEPYSSAVGLYPQIDNSLLVAGSQGETSPRGDSINGADLPFGRLVKSPSEKHTYTITFEASIDFTADNGEYYVQAYLSRDLRNYYQSRMGEATKKVAKNTWTQYTMTFNPPVGFSPTYAGLHFQTYNYTNQALAAPFYIRNVVITEIKKHGVITYNGGGAENEAPVSVYQEAGTLFRTDAGDTLIRRGYEFIGWGLGSSPTEVSTVYKPGQFVPVPYGDITLTAMWQKKTTFTVSFDTKGGSPNAASLLNRSYLTKEDLATASAGLTKQPFLFAGWSLSDGGNVIEKLDSITEDITLYAVWNTPSWWADYKLSYTGSNGKTDKFTFKNDTSNYDGLFTSWSVEPEKITSDPAADSSHPYSVKIGGGGMNLNFIANSSASPATKAFDARIPDIEPGYDWVYLRADVYAVGTPTGSVIAYADKYPTDTAADNNSNTAISSFGTPKANQWTRLEGYLQIPQDRGDGHARIRFIPNGASALYITNVELWFAGSEGGLGSKSDGFTLSFDANGGTGVQESVAGIPLNTRYTLPTTTTFKRDGYTFGGWMESPQSAPVSSIVMNDNKTMYAYWKKANSGSLVEFSFEGTTDKDKFASAGANLSRSYEQKHNGDYSMKVAATELNANYKGAFQISYANMGITRPGDYEINFRVYVSDMGTQSGTPQIQIQKANYSAAIEPVISSNYINIKKGEWALVTTTVTITQAILDTEAKLSSDKGLRFLPWSTDASPSAKSFASWFIDDFTVAKTLGSEDEGLGLVQSSAISATANTEYLVPVSISNATNLSGVQFTVTYDPAVMSLVDFAAQTVKIDTAVGTVTDTSLTIVSHASGKLVFKVDTSITAGTSWSGCVTLLKFKALQTQNTIVTVQ